MGGGSREVKVSPLNEIIKTHLTLKTYSTTIMFHFKILNQSNVLSSARISACVRVSVCVCAYQKEVAWKTSDDAVRWA